MGRLRVLLTKEQNIINAINSQVSFTSKGNSTKRYVVGRRNLFKGKNPSLNYKDIYKDVFRFVKDAEDSQCLSIGGWTDENTGEYYVDRGFLTDDHQEANDIGAYNGEMFFYDTVEGKELIVITNH